MKSAWIAGLAAMLPWLALAQPVDVRSNGSMGALNIDVNSPPAERVMQVPPDGVFHYTTITIGADITFVPNASNTPVYLLATGNVNIDARLDLDGLQGTAVAGGRAGPGGFDGGGPVQPGDLRPTWGRGPGGGAGTVDGVSGFNGVHATVDNANDRVYGTPLLMPLVGGSGGGGTAVAEGLGGGGGGGAILIGSNASIRIGPNGEISANGGPVNGFSGHGSGGAIRLVAPSLGGGGRLNASPGGRIRMDMIEALDVPFVIDHQSVAASTGALMRAFLPNPPSIRVASVGGRPLADPPPAQPAVLLPFDAAPIQDVVVEARNFRGVVPVRVVAKAQRGDPHECLGQIDMNNQPTATTTLRCELDPNLVTHLEVHTIP